MAYLNRNIEMEIKDKPLFIIALTAITQRCQFTDVHHSLLYTNGYHNHRHGKRIWFYEASSAP